MNEQEIAMADPIGAETRVLDVATGSALHPGCAFREADAAVFMIERKKT